MRWQVELHVEFLPEFLALAEGVQTELAAALVVLEQVGPALGRPLVDTIKGSSIANLKELRFSADGGVWRTLFAFDANRVAIVVAVGNKRGVSQARFYKALIAKAERRLKE